jgi:hypothetical protein
MGAAAAITASVVAAVCIGMIVWIEIGPKRAIAAAKRRGDASVTVSTVGVGPLQLVAGVAGVNKN